MEDIESEFPGAKTWDNITCFDDIVLEEEKIIIEDLERKMEVKCIYMKKEGKYFYYCAKDMPEIKEDEELGPFHPIYQRKISVVELQMYCMDPFGKCSFLTGEVKR